MSMTDGTELEEYKSTISEEERRGFAALAWTFPATSDKIMDPVLAAAFADVIDIIINGGYDTVDSYMQDRNQYHEQDKLNK